MKRERAEMATKNLRSLFHHMHSNPKHAAGYLASLLFLKMSTAAHHYFIYRTESQTIKAESQLGFKNTDLG